MKVQFKLDDEFAKVPVQSTKGSAGYDIVSCSPDTVVLPHQSANLRTGLHIMVPEGYFGAIYPRSGLGCKHGIRLSNCVGVIDSDYTGEIRVILRNDSDVSYTVKQGERVAQLIIQPFVTAEFEECDMLQQTARGCNGFGSTGK